MSATSVLIVDDNNTFAEAMRFAIDRDPALQCIGIAHDAPGAVDAVHRDRPDNALVNLDVPGADGLEMTRVLRRASASIALTVLTSRTDPETVLGVEQAGANHFIPKQSSMSDVLDALRSAHHGRMTMPGTMMIDLLRQRAPEHRHATDGLTARELDVLRGMAGGEPPKTIARSLGISVHTVRGHVKNIYWKLDAHSQLEAVAIARRQGLVTAVA